MSKHQARRMVRGPLRAKRRGVAFRVLACTGIDAWNRLQQLRSDRRDAPWVLRWEPGPAYHTANSQTRLFYMNNEQQGVDVVTHHFDWGSIAVFTDPDRNRCELKTAPMRQPRVDPGRRVYPNAIAANGSWRRPACELPHGMQRPSDLAVTSAPFTHSTRLLLAQGRPFTFHGFYLSGAAMS